MVGAQPGTLLAEFGYDSQGTRLWKRDNQNDSTLQLWIGSIYEEKGGKNLFHVFAGSERVCTFESTSTLAGGSDPNAVGYYYHEDQLTSSSALSGSSGNQVEVNVWYPFGSSPTTTPQAAFQVSRRFTGQIFDADTGLYYYNARYYDPELGRFVQADTVLSDISNPQSYNRYAYVLNNPLCYTDPTGHGWGWLYNRVPNSWVQYFNSGASEPRPNPTTAPGSNLGQLQAELGGYDATALHTAGHTMKGVGETVTLAGVYNAGYTAVTRNDAMHPDETVSRGDRISATGETALAVLPLLGKVASTSSKSIRTFKSFDAFKAAKGAAGEGRVWHHIVEQRAANVERFGAEAIHNTENVINVSRELNQKIANYYASKQPFTKNLTVREWLGTQTYRQQRQFGLRILKQFMAAEK